MSKLVYSGDFSVRTKLAKGGMITLLEAIGIGNKVQRGDVLSLPTFPDVEVIFIEDNDSVIVHSNNKVSKDFTNANISVR